MFVVNRDMFGILFIFCVLVVCQSGRDTWYSSSNVVQRDTSSLYAKKFACVEQLEYGVDKFALNVSLNSSARLSVQTASAYLALSSDDNLWHYIKSKESNDLYTAVDVHFMLVYESMVPGGNCTYMFQSENSQDQETSVFGQTTVTLDPSFSSASISRTLRFTMSTEILEASDVSQTASMSTIDASMTVNASSEENNKTSTDDSPEDVCLCPCACVNQTSQEKADRMLADMLEDMQVHKLMTSHTRRKLSSATDQRVSSTSIGLLGVFVLTAIFGIIMVGDAKLFMRNVRSAANRVHGNLRYRMRRIGHKRT